MPGAPKLAVSRLCKSHGTVRALDDVSLEVCEGEFLTLLGPSGSGKTTLLMIVAGLQQQDSGEIWIDSKPASNLPPRSRDIGVVFQSYALFPHLTVFDNVAFPLQMRRRPAEEIEQKVSRILSVIELSQARDRLPRELSGGQQQRVALARATVYQPSLVLMDEPLGALDRRLREQMQQEIKRLHKALGITVLYVTHDQEEAMSMSDRICLMKDGRVEQLATPETLYFNPATRFAANFLGESNIFTGRIRTTDAQSLTVTLPAGSTVSIPRPTTIGVVSGDIQFMLRPESLTLAAPGDATVNRIEGAIADIAFAGNSYKMIIRVEGSDDIILRMPANSKAGKSQVGDTVAFGWHTRDAVVFS